MSLDLSAHSPRLVFLSIAAEGDIDNTIHLNADWLPLDINGDPIDFIGQKKDSESKPFADYPADVRSAILTLNAYATDRISTGYGLD